MIGKNRYWGLLLLSGSLLAWPGVLPAQEGKWKFVLFGDSIQFDSGEINTNILSELAAAVVRENPAFLVFAGDFSFTGNQAALQRWTNVMSPVYEAGIKVYPVVGNHDVGFPDAYTNVTSADVPDNGPPGEEKMTYALAYSNALLLVVNEFTPTNDYRVNQAWVDAVLATNTLPHVFAVGHATAFSVYHYECLGLYVTNRDIFWNSLSNAQCRAYFCGHDHFYDHCRMDDGDEDPQNDLHQFTVGTGGSPFYPDGGYRGQNSLWTPRRYLYEAQYGYLSVEIAGADVTTTWHHRTDPNTYPAAEVFTYSLIRRPYLHHNYAGGQLTLTWSGNALLEASSGPAGPFWQVRGAVSPFVTNNQGTSRVFYRLVGQPQ